MSTTAQTLEGAQGAVNNPKHVESALPATAKMPSRLDSRDANQGVPFGRLVRVELRKMTDTKAGRWLMYGLGGVIAIAVIAVFFNRGGDHPLADYMQATVMPVAILLPVIGILAVTSEWSQRTGLVTFALEPRRGRVAWAKVVASLFVGVVALVSALVLAAIVHWAAITFRGATGDWTLEALPMLGAAAFVLLGMLQGLGFGMLFKNTPAAIVVYFVLPMVWPILTELITSLREPSKWLDMGTAMQPLFLGSLTGQQWAQLATSVTLWVGVPFVVGMWMLRRSEVK